MKRNLLTGSLSLVCYICNINTEIAGVNFFHEITQPVYCHNNHFFIIVINHADLISLHEEKKTYFVSFRLLHVKNLIFLIKITNQFFCTKSLVLPQYVVFSRTLELEVSIFSINIMQVD